MVWHQSREHSGLLRSWKTHGFSLDPGNNWKGSSWYYIVTYSFCFVTVDSQGRRNQIRRAPFWVGPTGKLRANGLKMIKIRVFLKGRVGLAHPLPASLLMKSVFVFLIYQKLIFEQCNKLYRKTVVNSYFISFLWYLATREDDKFSSSPELWIWKRFQNQTI